MYVPSCIPLLACAVLTLPLRPGSVTLQTIKSRLQSAPHGTYSGFMDCVSKTVKAHGVKALWKGFGPAMSRAFPANAAT